MRERERERERNGWILSIKKITYCEPATWRRSRSFKDLFFLSTNGVDGGRERATWKIKFLFPKAHTRYIAIVIYKNFISFDKLHVKEIKHRLKEEEVEEKQVSTLKCLCEVPVGLLLLEHYWVTGVPGWYCGGMWTLHIGLMTTWKIKRKIWENTKPTLALFDV